MKRIVYFWALIFIALSCEDAIDVDLNDSEPKLVIEATVTALVDGSSNATVRLTTTAPFFDTQIPFVDSASVLISSSDGQSYPFTYTDEGLYVNTDLNPSFGISYTLQVIYQGETYTATTTLISAVPLEFVEQRNDGGISGEDIELKAFFTDPAGVENYYFFEGLSTKGNVFDAYDDRFFDGNPIFGFYLIEDIEPGDTVLFNLHGVDEQFFNFMITLLQQSTDLSDGPFETQPATVRGNIINTTNSDNFPLGYFRISELFSLEYIVQ